ncbi:hypothetical protein IEN85_19205 [Pelagicoccus sp. NFK12]|uniref:Signal transduction histidine kinase subgroup 3 dimerisation and phosphoacceptor domain-containing protein n=1 Tax=Pelagicoccus enzymogenes TaxID=2773457 RepID=A0A927FDZ2_9BACT|nr:histidine kinase [Pelagicoccus enzymogenes]MBD5781638.1 hypothetical protein [Pelagicoccus enzymogenes]
MPHSPSNTIGLAPAAFWALLIWSFIGLTPLAKGQVELEGTTWAQRLLRSFSSDWNELSSERESLPGELVGLPEVPTAYQGGSGGMFGMWYVDTENKPLKSLSIRVMWDEAEWIDFVSLVPARSAASQGGEWEYGVPESFEIELLDRNGDAIATIAQEEGANRRLVRRGFPFTYSLDAPVKAHGALVRSRGISRRMVAGETRFYLAWAELFAFAGEYNVAEGATVELVEDRPTYETWYWNDQYLVDSQTPLGLPEIPSKNLRHVGWLSQARHSEDDSIFVTLELPEAKQVNGLRLFPARRPAGEVIPGFALPQRFYMSAIDENGKEVRVLDRTSTDASNPGQNPVTYRFPSVRASKFRLECVKIWKRYPHYPAFIAFSEVQLLEGETCLSKGAKVRTSDGETELASVGNLFWSPRGLTNGAGPSGALVARREWLELLQRRNEVETRMRYLELRMGAMEHRWEAVVLYSVSGFGVIALVFLIVLPIRYRRIQKTMLSDLRHRIANDLHDEVGANLSSIAGTSELLEEMTGDSSPKQRELMADIRRTARKTAQETRRLIGFLERRELEGSVEEHLRQAARTMLKGIDYRFEEGEWEAFESWPQRRKWDLLLFFKEVLHNIVKHSAARSVSIEIKDLGKAGLLLRVVDDGKGISGGRMPRHLKERSKRLRALLSISSRKGGGTEVRLTIPRKKQFLWILK